MNRHTWLLVSGCAWAVMMWLLFEREIRPYFEYQSPPSYRTLLQRKRQPEMEKRGIYFASQRIGEAESLIEPQSADGGARLRSRLALQMKPFGAPTLGDDRVSLTSDVRVDANYQLAGFQLEGHLQGIPLSAKGRRQGGKLRLSYHMLLFNGDQEIDFPPDATLADNFLPYVGGGGLTEGKKWKMKLFDVGNLVGLGKKDEKALTDLYASVVGREMIEGRGRQNNAFKIEVRKQPTDEYWAYTLWVDEEGVVLQQLMKINKLPCKIVLEEQRTLTPEAAQNYRWSVDGAR
jgi:hypothetical protein